MCEEKEVLVNAEAPANKTSQEVVVTEPKPMFEKRIVPRSSNQQPHHHYRPFEQQGCDIDSKTVAQRSEYLDLQKKTTTLYAEKPLMILPSDQYGGAAAMLQTSTDDQYLQIVLPVSQIQIMNGLNGVNGIDGGWNTSIR